MKKLACLAAALTLAACTSTVPDDGAGPTDEQTGGETSTSPATDETTTPEQTEEEASPSEGLVTYGLPVGGIDIQTGTLTTHVDATGNHMTVTHTVPSRPPIEATRESDGINERLGYEYGTASDSGCQLDPIVYMTDTETCAGSDAFVATMFDELGNDPMINPGSVTVTLTPDLPDGREAAPLTVTGLTVSDGSTEGHIDPEHVGDFYYSILTLLATEPSGDYCDTAAGIHLSFTHDGSEIYTGDFGICQIEAHDYVAAGVIQDVISAAMR